MLPDFSALFHTDDVQRLRFRARRGANFAHDVVFLSSYLHDARFVQADVAIRGDKFVLRVARDCWELGVDHPDGTRELYSVRSRLVVGPVSSARWETTDADAFSETLEIESVYLGPAHWEEPGASELVITAPHGGWRLVLSIADDFPTIRLDDLEEPRPFAGRA